MLDITEVTLVSQYICYQCLLSVLEELSVLIVYKNLLLFQLNLFEVSFNFFNKIGVEYCDKWYFKSELSMECTWFKMALYSGYLELASLLLFNFSLGSFVTVFVFLVGIFFLVVVLHPVF